MQPWFEKELAEREVAARDKYTEAPYHPRDLPATLDKARKEVTEKWAVHLEAKQREFDTTVSGTVEEVLNDIDLAAVDTLTFTSPNDIFPKTKIAVRLSRQDGCVLDIRGEDPEWVRAAHSSMVDELKRGVPWWHWLRSFLGATLLSMSVSVCTAVVLLVAGGETSGSWSSATIVGLVAAWSIFVGAMATDALLKNWLPGFEVLEAGVTSKGNRVLARVLGSLVLGILGSVIATWLLQD